MKTLAALPPLPPIGRSEKYYASRIRHADQRQDALLHESLKVGQYVSLGLSAGISWSKKARYFEHAIHRHCQPPLDAADEVATFYGRLTDLVQRCAGEEACAAASRQDDSFAERLRKGEKHADVRAEAIAFFNSLLGEVNRMPDHFHFEDWHAIKIIRDAWL